MESSESRDTGDQCKSVDRTANRTSHIQQELLKTGEGGGDRTPNGESLSGKAVEGLGEPPGEVEGEMSEAVKKSRKTKDHIRPLDLTTPPVPASSQCEGSETDSVVAEMRKAPTEVMSPRSYSVFKSSLVHVPEMNLPWESMRKTSKCGCGVTFSYSVRKVSCY